MSTKKPETKKPTQAPKKPQATVASPEEVSKAPEAAKPQSVKMKFSEHKYYNDLNVPMFEAGKVYVLEGADWIQRWIKRGGQIVEGELEFPEVIPNPSVIVSDESNIDSPVESMEDGATEKED